MASSSDESISEPAERLVEILRGYGSVAVAFSAGVDSTVVAKAAQLALGENAVAVTADSPSLAEGELDEARQLAGQIGIRHEVVSTQEFSDENYLSNPSNRCYFCKSELYAHVEALLPRLSVNVMVNGANLDDQGDHRPGMQAAGEYQVRSPLIEAGIGKETVRELARFWELPVWDKPAMPCLSSRIAYGVEVTPDRVRRIDAAEQLLATLLDTRELRVRLEAGDLARIEVPLPALQRLAEPSARDRIVTELRSLGFQYVTLDLEGFRSGSLNSVLSVDEITLPESVAGNPASSQHNVNAQH